MKLGRLFFALLLIATGVLLLLINLNVLDLALYSQWPLILILGGLGMWAGFIDNRRDWGLLIPGTTLVCAGALFYVCSVVSWRHIIDWWPVLIIAPGLGLFCAYLFGERLTGLFIPAAILTVIGVVMLLQIQLRNYNLMLPILFITAGLIVLVAGLRGASKKRTEGDERRDNQRQ